MLRPAERADSLMAELRARGHTPTHHPLLDFAFEDLTALRDQLTAGSYDWLVLTSVSTLAAFRAGSATEQRFQVACVGPGTARAAADVGLRVHLTADGSGADLADRFPAGVGRVAFPASSEADPDHAHRLEAKGWQVDRIIAYRPVIRPLPDTLVQGLQAGQFGAVILTSPMMAREVLPLNPRAHLIAIGEPTARAIRDLGVACTIAAAPTDSALADALKESR